MSARLLVALALLLTLSACDAFGERERDLAYRTLVQTDTLVVGAAQTEQVFRSGEPVRLQSPADADAFVRDYALSGPLPAVDFATQSVVGFVATSGTAGGRVTIAELARLGDDALRLRVVMSGISPPADTTGAPVFYPVHLVATPRLDAEITGWSIRTEAL